MKYQLLRNFLISSLLLTFPLLRAETALKNGETTSFRVRKEVKHQVIDNFGASDAWRIAFIGKYWPVEKREKIADLLFSTKMDANGNPVGIGLSNWRVNIGAGSFENRENNEVTSVWNRTECFLSPDGSSTGSGPGITLRLMMELFQGFPTA